MRLVLADGTLIVNFGEFTDGKVKVDARKDFSNNGADSDSYPDPSSVALRKIGHFLIGLSGVVLLYTNNDKIEYDESENAPEKKVQEDDFKERNITINNIALAMLVIGGFINVFAEE